MASMLVDREVTKRKFSRELELWKAHGELQKRGWLLLNEDYDVPFVELALVAPVPTWGISGKIDCVVCAMRLTFDNYDLWPPSLTFIDIFTREPNSPSVRAFLMTSEGPRDVLINGHPTTNRPFICLPGIREYHSHPQHTGDDWHLHRPGKEGSISVICDRIWLTMAKNVVGLHVTLQTLPTAGQQAQFSIRVAQGNLPAVPDAVPQEVV